MKPLQALIALLMLSATPCHPADHGPPTSECTPSFIELSPGEPIRAETGSWRVVFKVALVGCEEHLGQIPDEGLEAIRREFRNPSEWSNLLLATDAHTPEFRRSAVQRIRDLVGAPLVTDVLVHDVNVLDHNLQ